MVPICRTIGFVKPRLYVEFEKLNQRISKWRLLHLREDVVIGILKNRKKLGGIYINQTRIGC